MAVIMCKNCGHENHCGVPLFREQKDGDNKTIVIQVCNQCRCVKCEVKTDWG